MSMSGDPTGSILRMKEGWEIRQEAGSRTSEVLKGNAKEGNFGYREAISMFVIAMTIKSFFSSPAAASKLVGTALWYMVLISGLTAAFLFMFQYLLLKRFPNLSIMEIADNVLGKFLARYYLYCAVFLFLPQVLTCGSLLKL